jgi:hypothetical protein
MGREKYPEPPLPWTLDRIQVSCALALDRYPVLRDMEWARSHGFKTDNYAKANVWKVFSAHPDPDALQGFVVIQLYDMGGSTRPQWTKYYIHDESDPALRVPYQTHSQRVAEMKKRAATSTPTSASPSPPKRQRRATAAPPRDAMDDDLLDVLPDDVGTRNAPPAESKTTSPPREEASDLIDSMALIAASPVPRPGKTTAPPCWEASSEDDADEVQAPQVDAMELDRSDDESDSSSSSNDEPHDRAEGAPPPPPEPDGASDDGWGNIVYEYEDSVDGDASVAPLLPPPPPAQTPESGPAWQETAVPLPPPRSPLSSPVTTPKQPVERLELECLAPAHWQRPTFKDVRDVIVGDADRQQRDSTPFELVRTIHQAEILDNQHAKLVADADPYQFEQRLRDLLAQPTPEAKLIAADKLVKLAEQVVATATPDDRQQYRVQALRAAELARVRAVTDGKARALIDKFTESTGQTIGEKLELLRATPFLLTDGECRTCKEPLFVFRDRDPADKFVWCNECRINLCYACRLKQCDSTTSDDGKTVTLVLHCRHHDVVSHA